MCFMNVLNKTLLYGHSSREGPMPNVYPGSLKQNVVTFVPSESARPDQVADLIKELYILYIFAKKILFGYGPL